MYARLSRFVLALALLPAFASQSRADTPRAIPVQAILKTAAGQPITNAAQNVTLSLYTVPGGGAAVYSETKAVVVTNGLCSTTIGTENPAAFAALPFNVAYWIGISIGADPEMTPRIALLSAPYALYANGVAFANVTGVPTSLPPSGAAGGALSGTYPNPSIAANAVMGANVVNGSLTALDFTGGVLTPGGPAGGDLSGTYPTPEIRSNSIDSTKLASDAGSLYRVSGGGIGVNDQAWTDQSNTSMNTTGSLDAWQSFTPALDGYLKVISLQVGSTGASSYTTTLRVYSGEGIGGTLLRSQVITIQPTLGTQLFWLASPLAITPGNKYTWSVANAANSQIRYNTVNSYAGGRADLNASWDYYFRTYMSPNTSVNILDSDAAGRFSNGLIGSSAYFYGVSGVTTRPGYSGIYGSDGAVVGAYAGTFDGDVRVLSNLNVTGTLTKGAGAFKIDHPMDPANKTLSHSFVESPDMMNIYNGNVRTDKRGRAVVKLPTWFSALNKDFRYQLTPIGVYSDAFIEKEVANNQFVIRTIRPGVKVSWQVTGIRNDAYAKAHRIPTEEVKTKEARGTYFFPDGFRNKQTASRR